MQKKRPIFRVVRVTPCTVLVVDAGVGGALPLRLVLWGLWVDDGRVPLLQHLLHQGVRAHVILAVRPAVFLHCERTQTRHDDQELLIGPLFQDSPSVSVARTPPTRLCNTTP